MKAERGRGAEARREEQDGDQHRGEERQHGVLPAHEHHRPEVDLVGDMADVVVAFRVAFDECVDHEGRHEPDDAECRRNDCLLQHRLPRNVCMCRVTLPIRALGPDPTPRIACALMGARSTSIHLGGGAGVPGVGSDVTGVSAGRAVFLEAFFREASCAPGKEARVGAAMIPGPARRTKNVICGVGECGAGQTVGIRVLPAPVRRPRYRPGPSPYGAPQLKPSRVVVFGRYSQPIQPP